MECTFHDAQKEIANIFRCIDKDLSTLNDRANCRQEQEKTLVLEVQKDCDQQWKLIHHLEALEQREQDREVRIALQEDQIHVRADLNQPDTKQRTRGLDGLAG